MKRALLILCFSIMGTALPALADGIKGKEISIHEYMFEPKDIIIAAGTSVTWINHDEVPHTIVDTGKAFRSSALDTDDRFSYTFTKPGVYKYFCTLHPQMVGTVTVTAKP